MTSARSTICSGEACAGGTCRVVWLRKTSRMQYSSNPNGAHGTMRPLTFMISQRHRFLFGVPLTFGVPGHLSIAANRYRSASISPRSR
jgi:hypothetical protein